MSGRRYSPEVREQTIAMVRELRGQFGSLWATIEAVSSRTGVHTSTVRAWWRAMNPDELKPSQRSDESDELRRLRAELGALTAAHRELIENIRSTR